MGTMLLQLLDDGRLTDSKGRTVDFTNTVIILTSNVGAELLLEATTQTPERRKATHKLVMDHVRSSFAPEFLNRLNSIIMFNSLGKSHMERIVQKAITGVKRRLRNKGIGLVLEQSGAKAILESSYDPNYGARPVERYLEGSIVTELSRMLISGELRNGTTVHIEGTEVESDEESSIDDCNYPLAKKTRRLRYRIENRIDQNMIDDEKNTSDFDDM